MRKHVRELEKYRIYLIIAWVIITSAWIIAAICYYIISVRTGTSAYVLPAIAACVFFLFGSLPWLTVETLRDAAEQMAIAEESKK